MKGGGPFRRFVCAALLVTAHGGCVVQNQYRDGHLVSRSVGIGVARIPDCDPKHSSLVTTSALGAGVGQNGLMLGAVQATRTCIPLECKAVFWVDNPAIVDEVKKLVGADESMCVVRGEGN